MSNLDLPIDPPIQSAQINTGQVPFRDENGRINPNDAWDFAHRENDFREDVIRYEEVREKGLSDPKELYNVEVMELLKQEFPYALHEQVDADTGEKAYIAGISFFELHSKQFRPTKESQELLNAQPTLIDPVTKDCVTAKYLIGPKGFLVFSRKGIYRFDDIEDLKADTIFDKMPSRGSLQLTSLSEIEQTKMVRILNYVNRYGEKLDTKDFNTIDSLREKILSVKNMGGPQNDKPIGSHLDI